ncbi:MIR motif-containing protein [Sporodiniella umbellata]|nr:MIR motif-containing protein [Sporodiniella umbellata]
MTNHQGGRPKHDGIIRYGDHVSLKHVATGRFLSSTTETYGSGSFQQKVFTTDESPNEESTWIVLPPVQTEEEPGYEVGWDDPIRLKHIPTRANLHSHEYQSPISGQQEVAGFGNDENTDDNDVWTVKQFDEDDDQYDDFWRVGQPAIIRHNATGKILHSHDLTLEDGKNEVTAFEGTDENDKWIVSFD